MSVAQQNGKFKGFTQSLMKVQLIAINNFNRVINHD